LYIQRYTLVKLSITISTTIAMIQFCRLNNGISRYEVFSGVRILCGCGGSNAGASLSVRQHLIGRDVSKQGRTSCWWDACCGKSHSMSPLVLSAIARALGISGSERGVELHGRWHIQNRARSKHTEFAKEPRGMVKMCEGELR